jgi:hypothetical protein
MYGNKIFGRCNTSSDADAIVYGIFHQHRIVLVLPLGVKDGIPENHRMKWIPLWSVLN